MIKSRIKGINLEYGNGKTELISGKIMTKYGEIQKLWLHTSPPKINWNKDEVINTDNN